MELGGTTSVTSTGDGREMSKNVEFSQILLKSLLRGTYDVTYIIIVIVIVVIVTVLLLLLLL